MRTGNNYSGARWAFSHSRGAGKTCGAPWWGNGLAVTCDEPSGHEDLHHGVLLSRGEEPLAVIWLNPGTDLLRVDDGGIYAAAPDV